MGTILVLKELEKSEFLETNIPPSFQEAAVVLDFNQKYQQKLYHQKIRNWAMDGLEVIKVIRKDYENLMQILATQISSEQLAKITNLSAEDQISEDLRRLDELVELLSSKILSRNGLTLQAAFDEIKQNESTEMGSVAVYLEQSDYPLFQVMMKVLLWSSREEGVDPEILNGITQDLLQMAAYDSASALIFLNSRI